MTTEGVVIDPDSQGSAAPSAFDGIPLPALTLATAPEPDAEGAPAGDSTTPDPNEKRLSDTEAALKEAQRQLHETTGQLKVYGEQQAALLQGQQTTEAPKDYLVTGDWNEKFLDKPGEAFTEAMRLERAQLGNGVAQAMEENNAQMLAQFQALLANATNPDRQSLTVELTEAATQIPGFEALPPETQIAMAKALKTQKGPETLTAPAGSPAGTGVANQAPARDGEYAKKVAAMKQHFFGSTPQPGQEQHPSVAGIASTFVAPNGNGA